MMRLFRAAPTPVVTAPVLHIGDRVVPVELVASPRARRLILRADAVRGTVRVSLPPRVSKRAAMDFVEAQHGWIAARVNVWPEAITFVPGATIPFDGGNLQIDWSAGRARGLVRYGDRLLAGGDVATLAGRVRRWLRAQALADMEPETHRLAARIGVRVAKVAVRDPAGRWGSCATSSAIAYSWRLILAPPEVRASVIAHEVAHLRHHNHGKDFWALAAELNGGDPTPQRRWLARHGAALHWVGRDP